MRVAIAGAAGWIGRTMTDLLVASHELVLVENVAPEEATVFDPSSPTGRTLAPITPELPYHRVDIADASSLV